MASSEAVPQSFLSMTFQSLGFFYTAALFFAALVSFVLTIVILVRGRGPMSAAALVLIVNVPLMIGLFAAFQGMIASMQVMAMSGSTPKPAELMAGFATAMFAPLTALFLMVPSYSVAAIGAFIRSMRHKEVAS